MLYALYVLLIIHSIIVIVTAVFVILEDRPPEQTISWVLTLIFIPVLGIILYLNFGRNYRMIKVYNRKEASDIEQYRYLKYIQKIDRSEDILLNNKKIKDKKNIVKLLLNTSKSILTVNNKVKLLHNGDNTFNAIIEDLKQATHHIHLEFYIFCNDKIGGEIAGILKEKAREGVEVRFMYDGIGCWDLDAEFLEALEKAGVENGCFRPVRFPFFAHKVNYRNHRKIIVIDGNVGFVGGINIADRYKDGEEHLGFWRDTHLRLEGEAVHSLQMVFLTDWNYVTGQYLESQQFFPEPAVNADKPVQITSSGPDSDWESIMQAYFSVIANAQKSIKISTPYFMPPTSIMTALKTAALSDVDVKLIIPARSDLKIQLYGSMSYVKELLQAGVKVFLYEKGFNHGKLLMVDDIIASVGSANMDRRSFEKNLEINALIYDEEIVEELMAKFNEDIEDSRPITIEAFVNRPGIQEFKESFARMLSPMM